MAVTLAAGLKEGVSDSPYFGRYKLCESKTQLHTDLQFSSKLRGGKEKQEEEIFYLLLCLPV